LITGFGHCIAGTLDLIEVSPVLATTLNCWCQAPFCGECGLLRLERETAIHNEDSFKTTERRQNIFYKHFEFEQDKTLFR
jgi:hypothetical protein